MTVEKTFDQMAALLPYLTPIVNDEELEQAREKIRKERNDMSATQPLELLFPLLVVKHRAELYGILGVLTGCTQDEVKEMPFDKVKEAISSSVVDDFFSFFPFLLRLGMKS